MREERREGGPHREEQQQHPEQEARSRRHVPGGLEIDDRGIDEHGGEREGAHERVSSKMRARSSSAVSAMAASSGM